MHLRVALAIQLNNVHNVQDLGRAWTRLNKGDKPPTIVYILDGKITKSAKEGDRLQVCT
jgi:hypothetical protein